MEPGSASLSDLLEHLLKDPQRQRMITERAVTRFARPFGGWPRADQEAHRRGLRLLRENLSPAQRSQFEKREFFDVIGGKTGRRYRVRLKSGPNIDCLDTKGRAISVLCFVPKGGLVAGDVMLAQKLALELFEPQTLKIANLFSAKSPLVDRSREDIRMGAILSWYRAVQGFR